MNAKAEYATTSDIKAWDTEYGDYVAWGTHNPTVARTAVRKYILEVIGESPEHLDEMTPPVEDFRNAALYWADPKVIDKEENWGPSEFARHEEGFIPYDGWVPYMVVTQRLRLSLMTWRGGPWSKPSTNAKPHSTGRSHPNPTTGPANGKPTQRTSHE